MSTLRHQIRVAHLRTWVVSVSEVVEESSRRWVDSMPGAYERGMVAAILGGPGPVIAAMTAHEVVALANASQETAPPTTASNRRARN